MTDEHKTKVDNAEIVSFDIFDTLLARKTANPRDIFAITRELFNERSRYVISENFYDKRYEAEKTTRLKKAAQEEVTLDEIYEVFGEMYGYDKEFCNTLKEYELKTEFMMLIKDSSTVEIYDYAKNKNKFILLASDMPLPKKEIAHMLHENGIDRWDDLILSSDSQTTKSNGSTYAEIVKRYPNKRTVHIGDNIHIDAGWADKFGFDVIHIHSNAESLSLEIKAADRSVYGGDRYRWALKEKFTSVSDTQFNILSGLTAQYCMQRNVGVPEAIGYSFFGPLLVSYVQWLHLKTQLLGTDHIFFLARDGAIMRDAYNTYYKNKAVPNSYMLGSRRLLTFPSIYKDNFFTKGVDLLSGGREAVNVSQTLRYYNVNPEERQVRKWIDQVGLSISANVTPGESNDRLRALLSLLAPKLLKQAKIEADEVLEYLRQIGFMQTGYPLVCDVGWNGSMQAALELLTDKKINGAYFGIFDTDRTRNMANKISGYCDCRQHNATENHNDLIKKSVNILETIFTNPDQNSIIGLREDNTGKYIGVEGRAEWDKFHKEQTKLMHEAALRFIEDFTAISLPKSLAVIRRKVALRPLEWMVLNPNDKVAELFGGYKYFHVISSVPDFIGYPKHNAEYYLEHHDELTEEYKHADWKKGFSKNCERLGISL